MNFTFELRTSAAAMVAPGGKGLSQYDSRLLSVVKDCTAAEVKAAIAKGHDVNMRGDLGETPLIRVAQWDNTEEGCKKVQILLEAGADVTAATKNGYTALMLVGHPPGYRVTSSQIARTLLAAGADVNARNTFNGATALMIAACHQDAGVVQVLLDAGAEVAVQDKSGRTAYTYANKGDNEAVIHLLKAHKLRRLRMSEM
jgi:ankyrin repeat protein